MAARSEYYQKECVFRALKDEIFQKDKKGRRLLLKKKGEKERLDVDPLIMGMKVCHYLEVFDSFYDTSTR